MMRRMITHVLTLVAAAAMALSLTSAPAGAESTTPGAAEEITAQVTRYSFSCGGDGTRRANFSYSPGSANTRIYYNNHCGRSIQVRVRMRDAIGFWNVCWTVPSGKGSREFFHSLTGNVVNLLGAC